MSEAIRKKAESRRKEEREKAKQRTGSGIETVVSLSFHNLRIAGESREPKAVGKPKK